MGNEEGRRSSDLPWNAIRADRSKCLYAANAIFAKPSFRTKQAPKMCLIGNRANDFLRLD